MKQSIKAGALFPQAARTDFMTVTRTRYQSMVDRAKRKELPPIPFSLEEFRAEMLSVMGGKEDGPIYCRYCKRYFATHEVAVDHATPLSRGGSQGLANIDYPCAQDNNRKGSLTLLEYNALLAFLDTQHPLMRQDVLSRLEKANRLAAGARRNQALIAEFKKTGQWGKKKQKQQAQPELDDF
jgi:hypothetical protein